MSEALDTLHRRLHTAGELKSIVRTMKTLAAVSIVPYERAVRSLADYYRTVELGLMACLANIGIPANDHDKSRTAESTGVVVFGSDQGMAGQFNDVLADCVLSELVPLPGKKLVWPIGERIAWRLSAPGVKLAPIRAIPESVAAITPLIAAILDSIQQHRQNQSVTRVLVFHNQPLSSKGYRPARQQLLPFDREWLGQVARRKRPTKMIPQVMPVEIETLEVFLREYLFVSLFRACAESLASESAARLTAMQAAERKIGDLFEQLQLEFNQVRQGSIDEELFDVITGYEALSHSFR